MALLPWALHVSSKIMTSLNSSRTFHLSSAIVHLVNDAGTSWKWMMNGLLSALSQTERDCWHESVSGYEKSTWLPLFLISSSGLWIGLDERGQWVVGRLSGQVEKRGPRLSPGWLPLLDHDESVIKEELSYAATKYKLPLNGLLSSIPIDDTLLLALEGNSSHWIDRALVWLEHRPIRDDIAAILPSVVSSRSAGQRARQRAKRLMGRRE
jgi:hypothetical protein